MEASDCENLRKNRRGLVDAIHHVEEVITKLTQFKVISEYTKVDILERNMSHFDRVRELLNILPRRGPLAYGLFCKALEECEETDAMKLMGLETIHLTKEEKDGDSTLDESVVPDCCSLPPQQPDWSSFHERLHSFKNCPIQIKQTARYMAHAGLVYQNRGDSCFCFKCGIRLFNWKETDNPLTEHGHTATI